MDVTAIITQVVGREDQIPASDPDYTNRRSRCLEYLVEEFTDVYLSEEWHFRRRETTITVTAGDGYKAVPSDFQSFGSEGGVWLDSTGVKLRYVHAQELLLIRDDANIASTDNPTVFSIFDQETSSPFLSRIQIPTNTSNLVLRVKYLRDVPTLDESANVENSNYIPARYHQLVLVPGVRARMRDSVADVRYQQYMQQRANGLQIMREAEEPTDHDTDQFPSFFGQYVT